MESNVGPVSLPVHEMDAKTQKKFDSEIQSAVDVINRFFSPKLLKDQSIPRDLLLEAHGLMFLTVAKAGFLLAGKLGNGFVIARTTSGWSSPSFIGSAGLGFGMMLGAEVVYYMIILGSRGAVKAFTRNGQLQIGSELDLAVGPIGRAAAASVTFGHGGVSPNYSYSHAMGLYGGIGLASAVIAARKSLNAKCYGSDKTSRDILSGAVECKSSRPLWEALDRVMGIERTYDDSHRSGVNPRGISCSECGKFSPNGSRECSHCSTLLIYTIGSHSGKRKPGKMILSCN